MMSTPHSPVPFAIDGEGATVACLSGRHRMEITATLEANVIGVHTEERDAANAAFIVRACNSHEALLAALKRIVAHFGDPLQVARTAIDAAEAT